MLSLTFAIPILMEQLGQKTGCYELKWKAQRKKIKSKQDHKKKKEKETWQLG